MKRILVVRYSALGDVVLATAVLRALRAAHPRAEIDVLTQAQYAVVVAGWSDRVWTLDRSAPRLREIARLGPALRARGYDAVLDLQGKVTARLLARWTGAPRAGPPERPRLAPGGASPGEQPRWPVHALERYRRAAGPLFGDAAVLPAPRVVPPGGRGAARRRLEAGAPPGEGPLVALLPGARHPPKRWGAERFGRAAALLARSGCARVLLAGGPMDAGELEAARQAAAAAGVDVAAWSTGADVEALLAIVAGADLVIAGDTGALHLAAAAGTAWIGLFGPTDPGAWAPAGMARFGATDPGGRAPAGMVRSDPVGRARAGMVRSDPVGRARAGRARSGPADPGDWAPPAGEAPGCVVWPRPACAPCSTHGQRACGEPRRVCLDDLGVEEVVAAARAALAEVGAAAEGRAAEVEAP